MTWREWQPHLLTRYRSAPESQGVITANVTALARQNLQEVGRLVEAIATGRYRVPAYDVNMFASVEGYIQDAIPAFTEWILTRTHFLGST